MEHLCPGLRVDSCFLSLDSTTFPLSFFNTSCRKSIPRCLGNQVTGPGAMRTTGEGLWPGLWSWDRVRGSRARDTQPFPCGPRDLRPSLPRPHVSPPLRQSQGHGGGTPSTPHILSHILSHILPRPISSPNGAATGYSHTTPGLVGKLWNQKDRAHCKPTG